MTGMILCTSENDCISGRTGSTHNTFHNFQISLNHEFIHSWQYAIFGFAMKENDWNSYMEFSAYTYTKMYNTTINIPQYYGPILPYIWPQLPVVP